MTSVAAPTVVHTRAPGKINVFLAVGDLQDDGYHDLATAYQAVSLYEDVRARHADGFTVAVTGGPSIDVSGVPTDESNLAIDRFAGYAGGRPVAVVRSAAGPTAEWALAHGDTLHLRVVPTGGPKCSVTLTQGGLRLPERVQPVKEGLTRAFGVMGDRQN